MFKARWYTAAQKKNRFGCECQVTVKFAAKVGTSAIFCVKVLIIMNELDLRKQKKIKKLNTRFFFYIFKHIFFHNIYSQQQSYIEVTTLCVLYCYRWKKCLIVKEIES